MRSGRNGADGLDHPGLVGRGQCRTGGKAEPAFEDGRGRGPTHGGSAFEHGLEVEWFPSGSRFDVHRLEGQTDLLAVGAEPPGVDEDAGEPEASTSSNGRSSRRFPWNQ